MQPTCTVDRFYVWGIYGSFSFYSLKKILYADAIKMSTGPLIGQETLENWIKNNQ